MNAHQRRRHVRGVRLFPEIHLATRAFVTFAVARWDRARRRTRRYRTDSRAAHHNAALRARLAAHPHVRVWKEQHRLATYAATTEGIYAAVLASPTPSRSGLDSDTPRLFPEVTLAETAEAARWRQHRPATGRVTPADKAARLGPPTFPAALDTPCEGLVEGEVVLTGRFANTRSDPPMRNFPRAAIVGNNAEYNLVVEPQVAAADVPDTATEGD